MKLTVVPVVMIIALSRITSAHAHTPIGEVGQVSDYHWNPARVVNGRTPVSFGGTAPTTDEMQGLPIIAFGVALNPNRWPQGTTLRVCFYAGSPQLQQHILNVAQEWLTNTNLKIESADLQGRFCASKDTSHIRIGFSEPGEWSFIGTDSISTYLIDNDLASMNFQGFDKTNPAEADFRSSVLHEWGHAIGLEHEQQSPGDACSTFYDLNKIYTYVETNWGWTEDTAKQNFELLAPDPKVYSWTTFDPNTPMMYPILVQWLKDTTPAADKTRCTAKGYNSELTATDKKFVSKLYPPSSPAAVLQAAVAERTMLGVVLDQKIPTSIRVPLQRLQNIYRAAGAPVQ